MSMVIIADVTLSDTLREYVIPIVRKTAPMRLLHMRAACKLWAARIQLPPLHLTMERVTPTYTRSASHIKQSLVPAMRNCNTLTWNARQSVFYIERRNVIEVAAGHMTKRETAPQIVPMIHGVTTCVMYHWRDTTGAAAFAPVAEELVLGPFTQKDSQAAEHLLQMLEQSFTRRALSALRKQNGGDQLLIFSYRTFVSGVKERFYIMSESDAREHIIVPLTEATRLVSLYLGCAFEVDLNEPVLPDILRATAFHPTLERVALCLLLNSDAAEGDGAAAVIHPVHPIARWLGVATQLERVWLNLKGRIDSVADLPGLLDDISHCVNPTRAIDLNFYIADLYEDDDNDEIESDSPMYVMIHNLLDTLPRATLTLYMDGYPPELEDPLPPKLGERFEMIGPFTASTFADMINEAL